ncbi:MAG: DUF971 domain-containing protein [Planctomycetota bacterium]
MAHEPIQFGPAPSVGGRRDQANEAELPVSGDAVLPVSIDVDRDRALTVEWADGTASVLPVALLRRMSPSAEAKAWRDEQASNPLAVLPEKSAAALADGAQPLRIENAELMGNYAIRLVFSDGHSSGLYAWNYLRTLGEDAAEAPGP